MINARHVPHTYTDDVMVEFIERTVTSLRHFLRSSLTRAPWKTPLANKSRFASHF